MRISTTFLSIVLGFCLLVLLSVTIKGNEGENEPEISDGRSNLLRVYQVDRKVSGVHSFFNSDELTRFVAHESNSSNVAPAGGTFIGGAPLNSTILPGFNIFDQAMFISLLPHTGFCPLVSFLF